MHYSGIHQLHVSENIRVAKTLYVRKISEKSMKTHLNARYKVKNHVFAVAGWRCCPALRFSVACTWTSDETDLEHPLPPLVST